MIARIVTLIAVIAGLLTGLALPRDVSGNTPPARSCVCCTPATACCEPVSQPARPAPVPATGSSVDDLKFAMQPAVAVLAQLSGEERPSIHQIVIPDLVAHVFPDRLDLICIRLI